MSSNKQSILRAAFDAAFVYPFATHAWKSSRAHGKWIDMEVLQDALAGPLYSIVHSGGCAYVYAREDEYFTGVHDPATLHARLLEWHGNLIASLDLFVPASSDEADDLASMRLFVSSMGGVAAQAMEIERARWEATRDVPG